MREFTSEGASQLVDVTISDSTLDRGVPSSLGIAIYQVVLLAFLAFKKKSTTLSIKEDSAASPPKLS